MEKAAGSGEGWGQAGSSSIAAECVTTDGVAVLVPPAGLASAKGTREEELQFSGFGTSQ